jgi:hypothetical protein
MSRCKCGYVLGEGYAANCAMCIAFLAQRGKGKRGRGQVQFEAAEERPPHFQFSTRVFVRAMGCAGTVERALWNFNTGVVLLIYGYKVRYDPIDGDFERTEVGDHPFSDVFRIIQAKENWPVGALEFHAFVKGTYCFNEIKKNKTGIGRILAACVDINNDVHYYAVLLEGEGEHFYVHKNNASPTPAPVEVTAPSPVAAAMNAAAAGILGATARAAAAADKTASAPGTPASTSTLKRKQVPATEAEACSKCGGLLIHGSCEACTQRKGAADEAAKKNQQEAADAPVAVPAGSPVAAAMNAAAAGILGATARAAAAADKTASAPGTPASTSPQRKRAAVEAAKKIQQEAVNAQDAEVQQALRRGWRPSFAEENGGNSLTAREFLAAADAATNGPERVTVDDSDDINGEQQNRRTVAGQQPD